MKKSILLILLLCTVLSGCKSASTLTANQISERYQISEDSLKSNLNMLDFSTDALEKYRFKHYEKNKQIQLVSKDFSNPIQVSVTFDYALKGRKVILCFPPETGLTENDKLKTTVLDQWSAKLTENKLYLTARIAVETTDNTNTKRAVETVTLTIDDLI